MENFELSQNIEIIKEKKAILNKLTLDSDNNILIDNQLINKNGIQELNTSQNITLSVNTIYDVISSSVANSLLTLPTGTKTGQTIEIITSCSGFDSNNTFTISGKINGVASNTVTIRASYVKYTFIWSESSQTWVMPLNVIV